MAALQTRSLPPRGELTGAIAAVRRAFYSAGAFSLAINVLLLAPAIFMLQVYDRVLASRSEVTLAMLTLIVVALFALEAALEFVRSRVLVRTSAALDLRLNARVFDAAFERYLRTRGGSPAQALGDLANLRQFLTGQGLFAFFDAPWMPLYVVVIGLLNPWLGLFALMAALALGLMAWLNERATGPLLAEAGRHAASAGAYAASQLRNAEVIEAMGMLASLRARWFARQAGFLTAQAAASDRAGEIGAASRFLRLALQSGILAAGAYLVLQNQLSAGGMIAASILLGRALAPVELGIANWRGFVSARSAYARLAELLAAHPARDKGFSLPRPQGAVAAEGLVVGAPGRGEPILKGIDFRVEPGTLVGVVGPSASGKSTLARALVGVWAPARGAVRLDGAEMQRWERAELGPWIGYLPQDVELFDGTVAENIARFGEVDSARVVDAARRAGVHELVLRLPQGYETPIGESGTVLSGGQRQRVALARALYGEPALVVLDEPNASLDEAGDAALLAALLEAKEDRRTVFVMTQRANVLRAVDLLIVMAEGVVKASGPRDAVLNALRPQGQEGRSIRTREAA